MLFNSIDYLIFLPVVVAIYFRTPARWRWACLLFASYVFYAAWKPGYLILIVLSTVVDYCAGIALDSPTLRWNRRLVLVGSLVSNLGLLFFFKYFDFFTTSLNGIIASMGSSGTLPTLELILPVGISFYTFQTLSYTIDVYRRERKAERHFGIFALYVSFFPQLVAGPIERSTHLLPQFQRTHRFEYARVASGMRLMLWGFFKKIVIADRLALLVNGVYAEPGIYPGPVLVLATLFFAFQIYCDFSGYSDIAIGTARLMGFDLMQNFRSPYFSQSLTEFWQRWHISLSTWFRDYLYIPLGGNRGSAARTRVNLMIVFLLSGIWHGAQWTFLLWGAFHGAVLVVERQFRGTPFASRFGAGGRLGVVLRTSLCFVLVVFSWVFFRAASISQAFEIIARIPVDWHVAAAVRPFLQSLPSDYPAGHLLISLCAMVPLLAIEFQIRQTSFSDWLEARPGLVRWLVYYGLFGMIALIGESGSNQFIYFQF